MGVQKDPWNTDHIEEMELVEKRCIWRKAGCVCVGSLVFLGTGTRGPFHAPPQLKPMVRGEERKETGKMVPVTTESKESEVQDTEQKWQSLGREGLREARGVKDERGFPKNSRKNESSVARVKESERCKR